MPTADAAPVAVVTGAASGIGTAVADALAEAGWTVVGFDPAAPGTETAAVDMRRVDVTDEAAVADQVRQLETDPGRVDALVNVAGVIYKAPVEELDLDRWRRVFEVNVTGAMLCLKHLRGLLASSGRGRVINICSMTARVGIPTYSAYSASKAALCNLTQVWAAELAADAVTVNSISPGWVSTQMTEAGLVGELARRGGVDEERARADLLAGLPQGRLIEPAEVAATVAWLLGEDAASMTGADLVLDGGLTTSLGLASLLRMT